MRSKKALVALAAFLTLASTLTVATAAAPVVVDPALSSYLASAPLGTTAPAVITYQRAPGAAELSRLQLAGIESGFLLRQLPMVIADLDATRLAAVRDQPGVLSVWGNEVERPMTSESREFIGVPQLMADAEVTAANAAHPGLPVSGQGIGIGYVDTGVDATHPDLSFGAKTVENVNQPLAWGVVSDGGLLLGVGVSISDLVGSTGFVPPIYVEGQPSTDLESGHGTLGAAVAAGTGEASGDFYGGVAPGAHLVAVASGDDLGLPLVAILGAYDYLLVHQVEFNIRVINNSWGTSLSSADLDPTNPINVATRAAHDRNIVVVFAAGNAGDTPTAINPYSTMPWTISVAAGEKRGLGTPAAFSSRGVDDGGGTDVAGQPADPLAPPNLRPDVTAPGVDIISARAHTAAAPVLNAGGVLDGDAQQIPPAFLPFYLSSNGTSFACPHVSGVVALMLSADPRLTPDEVVTLLRGTATPMPYAERVVGAGYVDAHNAVRAALALAAVAHPHDLMPGPDTPEILDGEADQIGTTAQDILAGDFAYDATTDEIVYALDMKDLSTLTPGMAWYMSSDFGPTTIFVSVAIDETGTPTFEYGDITSLGGVTNQESLGAADSGSIEGNRITVRLARAKVSDAVGFDVLGTTSTLTQAKAQILIGTSLTGGLLLNADSAAGRDFTVGGDAGSSPGDGGAGGTGGGTSDTAACPGSLTERLTGTLAAGVDSTDVPLDLRCSALDAKLTYHPGHEEVTLELVDPRGQVVAIGHSGDGRKIALSGLAAGDYSLRVHGPVSEPVDFVIKSVQGEE